MRTKLGCEMQEHFVILENPPFDVISSFVYSDAIGENFCRLTASNLAILAVDKLIDYGA